jgi:hypothetical protein
MMRLIGGLVRDVLLAVGLALVLLAGVHLIAGEGPSAALGTAAHHLFLFMDIGLGVWVLLLVVFTVRRREAAASGRVIVSGIIGAVVNLLTVIAVGFVQQGGLATEFIGFATEAGIAFIVTVIVVEVIRAAATRRTRHARVADTAK